MTRDDWLFVGVKLVGVYFAVQGLTAVVVVVCGMAIDRLSAPGLAVMPVEPRIDMVTFALPVAHLLGAYLLIRRTEWCLRWIHPLRAGDHGGPRPSEGTGTGPPPAAPPSPMADADSER